MIPPEAIINKADLVTLNQLNAALSKTCTYSNGKDQPTTKNNNKVNRTVFKNLNNGK